MPHFQKPVDSFPNWEVSAASWFLGGVGRAGGPDLPASFVCNRLPHRWIWELVSAHVARGNPLSIPGAACLRLASSACSPSARDLRPSEHNLDFRHRKVMSKRKA